MVREGFPTLPSQMGIRYHFVTTMDLAADRSAVWSVLRTPEHWATWWKWLKKVDAVETGDETGVGAVISNSVATPFGYRLSYLATTTRTVEPELIEFDAGGDLIGRGQFKLIQTGDHQTRIVLNWLVETVKWWMNLTAPLARPVFSWSHTRLMTDFAEGLAEASGATLLRIDNHPVGSAEPGFYELSN